MDRKAQRQKNILQHGLNLIRIFNLPEETLPVTLCKRVHRLEAEAHHMAERFCNREITEEQSEKQQASIVRRLDAMLNFTAQNIPVFVNGDPRGYALKISDDYVREHNLNIHRDWGGCGIIAPEF